MKLDIGEGIKRVLIFLSGCWAIFTTIMLIASINEHKPFVDTITDKWAQYRVFSFQEKTISFISQYWYQVILFLIIPIIALWGLYYAIKWISSGFINK